MSADAPTPPLWTAEQSGRLASPLLELAWRVLGEVPPPLARHAAEAVRAFGTAPSPARYLVATRLLRAAEREHRLALLGRTAASRRAGDGLARLDRTAELPAEVRDLFAALPKDARTGRRLTLLADLITARRLLTACASKVLGELRRSLRPVRRTRATPAASPVGRGRGRPRR